MLAIFRKELKMLLREKGNFFFLLIMPILFIVMFGSIFGNTGNTAVKVHYIDQDKTQISANFIKQLKNIKGIALVKESPVKLDTLVNQIKEGQLTSVLVIENGFEKGLIEGKEANIKLYRDPSADAEVGTIQAILENISHGYQQQKLTRTLGTLGESKEQVTQTLTPQVQIEAVDTAVHKVNPITQIVPSMTVMFVFYIMISMTRRFFREKESGLLARCQSTKMKPYQYLVGMWLPYALALVVQSVILFGFGHFVYKLQLGNFTALSFMVICLSLCGSGIGLALSVFVRGENQGMAITQVIALGGAMIGGLWMPSSMMPIFVQTIGHFTPQFWAQQGLTNIFAHGATLSNIWFPLLVLVGFGLAGLLVAVLRLPHFMRSATN